MEGLLDPKTNHLKVLVGLAEGFERDMEMMSMSFVP